MAKKKKPVEQELEVQPTAIEEPDIVEEPAVTDKPVPTGFVVNCKLLNIRKEPSVKAEVLTTIPCGHGVIIEDESDVFCKVLTNGISGFCMKKYIKIPE